VRRREQHSEFKKSLGGGDILRGRAHLSGSLAQAKGWAGRIQGGLNKAERSLFIKLFRARIREPSPSKKKSNPQSLNPAG
jgi:hypothetical protein